MNRSAKIVFAAIVGAVLGAVASAVVVKLLGFESSSAVNGGVAGAIGASMAYLLANNDKSTKDESTG